MNIFSLLSLLVLPFYIFLGWYVYKLEPKSKLNQIFIFLSLSFSIWAFSFIFFYSAPDKTTAIFWYNLSALGRFFYPAILLNLALIFTKNRFNFKNWYYSLILYVLPFIFLYEIFTGPFITQDLVLINSQWFEVLITNNIWWYAYTAYYLFYNFLGLAIIGWWGYRSEFLREKRQALIIISTGVVAFSLGVLTNTVLQSLNVFVLPSMAQIFGIIFFSGIAYAIIRYKMLNLTAAVAAEQIITKIRDLVILMDPTGKIVKINPRVQKLLGYRESDLKDRNWQYIIKNPHNRQKLESYFSDISYNNLSDDKSFKNLEIHLQAKNEKQIPINSFLSTINDKYGAIGVVLVGQDMRQTIKLQHEVTEKIKAQMVAEKKEEKIKRSLKEKEILLREIHHRVKNNMQIISSLLNLQSGYLKDKAASDALKECQGRIISMAMIHENLYQSETLTDINFKEYIESMVNSLLHTYNVDVNKFKIYIVTNDIVLNIDTAIPCGLIINELVTNSLKHAFPDGASGEITIQLEQNNNEYYLMVADNGIGMPPELDINNSATLGLLLVNSLVGQLEGNLEVSTDEGTVFRITFKKLEYHDRLNGAE